VRNSGFYSVTCDGKPVRKLVFMKGGLRLGNRAVAADTNTCVCPEAGAGNPLTEFHCGCEQYRFSLGSE